MTPPSTPSRCSSGWLWQSPEAPVQCSSASTQRSALAGSGPSSASDAKPWKVTGSPTAQRCDGKGVSMTGAGAMLPTEMVANAVPDAPSGSLTRTPARTGPIAV